MTIYDNATKEKIINACLIIIKEEGFEGVTVRKITTMAQVNIALINYYFGSKEKLIDEATRIIVAGFRSSFKILDDTTLSPKERLKHFLMSYAGVIRKNSDLARRIIAKGAIFNDSQNEFMNFMRLMGFDQAKGLLREITGINREEALFMMLLQIAGAVIFPNLLAPMLKASSSDFREFNDQAYSAYIDNFIDLYFNKFQKKEDS